MSLAVRKTPLASVFSEKETCGVVGTEITRNRGFWGRFAEIPTNEG